MIEKSVIKNTEVGTFILCDVSYLVYGREVPGFTTMILIMLFGFSILFLMFGVMGNYIERIYDEVKERPNYIVRNEVGFKKEA